MWGGVVLRFPCWSKLIVRRKHALSGRDEEHSFPDVKKLLNNKYKKTSSCLQQNGKVIASVTRSRSKVVVPNGSIHSSSGVIVPETQISQQSRRSESCNRAAHMHISRWQTLDERLERIDSYAHVIAMEKVPDFNPRKSSSTVLAFGRHNASLRVNLSGQWAGFWYDFDPGVGGRIISLIQHVEDCTWKEALWIGEKIIAGTNEDPLDLSLRGEPGDSSQERMSRSCRATEFSDASVPLVNTLGEEYLRIHRRITQQPGKDVRFLHKERFLDSNDSILIQGRNHRGQITAVQKTFLHRATADKARVEKPKLTYGDMEGGSFVRVNDPVDPKASVSIFAEGLETALTVAQALHNQVPCYATLGIWNFSKIPLFLSRGAHAIICADHDNIENNKPRDSKIQAAFHASGWKRDSHSIIRPGLDILPKTGSDYNDVLRKYSSEFSERGFAEVRNDIVSQIPWLKPMAYQYPERDLLEL